MKYKYSTITGSLNNICDRYMSGGYKRPYRYEEIIDALVKIGVLDGVELSFSTEGGVESDEAGVKKLLGEAGLEASFVNSSLFGEQKWMHGSLSSADATVRKNAIDDTKRGLDFARSVGAGGYNLWTGQDGFDYPFQTDYARQWDWFLESVTALCDYAPDVKITMEPKLREPRNRSLIDTVPTALLICAEANRSNLGLTVDVGHTLQAGGNMARDLDMALKADRLFNVHANDNYGAWDDDLIVGSVRLPEFLEMFHVLGKRGYNEWISVDIFPYREDQFEAVRESILHMDIYTRLVEKIGSGVLDGLIESGSATEMMKILRTGVYSV